MDFLNGLTKLFSLPELMSGTLIICIVIFLAIWGFCKKLKQLKEYLRVIRGEDKNLPESFSVMTTDGAHLTLERDWIDGEWRYVLKDLPYRFGPVERSHLKIPECLKGKSEEQWLKNLDAITKSSEFDECVRLRYEQSTQVDRQMANKIAGHEL